VTPSWRTDKRTTAERGYGGRWQCLSKQFLRRPENALCVMCKAEGTTKQAEVVDHVTAHKGDPTLFWDQANWQGLCRSHHSRDKQAEERGFKRRRRIGVDGYPIE
jgi:5-methylcytosine-specific restriction protein A